MDETSRLLDLIKTLLPLATTVTALLVYFGWSYSHAKATRLGFDRMVTGPERGGTRAPAGRLVTAGDLREALRQALIED